MTEPYDSPQFKQAQWNNLTAALEGYWPRGDWGDEQLNLWRKTLESKRYTYDEISRSVYELSTTSSHPPRLADLVNQAKIVRAENSARRDKALEGVSGAESLPEHCICILHFDGYPPVAIMDDSWFNERHIPYAKSWLTPDCGLTPRSIEGNPVGAPHWFRQYLGL